ncbi:bacterial alpha-L-rhamnosidase domain protein [Aspergillus falconensis]
MFALSTIVLRTPSVHELKPRISWRFTAATPEFEQEEVLKLHSATITSSSSRLTPWPLNEPIASRERHAVRIHARGKQNSHFTARSKASILEVGLMSREDWHCQPIIAPWAKANKHGTRPEDLFRKEFTARGKIQTGRLYVTAFGVYEAEINAKRVGDHFLAPGWTSYAGRLQYQTYDVTSLIMAGTTNCIGIPVAEGWYSGRIGFKGGRRNIWGVKNAIFAQLEIAYEDGKRDHVCTDSNWKVKPGPARLADIYSGEKYDATMEVDGWSSPGVRTQHWHPVEMLSLPNNLELTPGCAEPVCRIAAIQPKDKIITPSGKVVLDFGQNLVGYTRIMRVYGHAELLEQGELCTRPLRHCDAQDTYTMKGAMEGESYEPCFTYHGFRYIQLDNWPEASLTDVMASIEAVVCFSAMETAGSFSCSDTMVNTLFSNIKWGMQGNFVSVPTDCPQRDERLGYSGDLALFAPTAVLGGTPPIVSPNALYGEPTWWKVFPIAIWHDVTILAPWTLWLESGDSNILARQYDSMSTWIGGIPRNKVGSKHLGTFMPSSLTPSAPPEKPGKAMTDPALVANAFLIRCLDIMVQVATILERPEDEAYYMQHSTSARVEFSNEDICPNGRILSDSQTAYALAICFDLFNPGQVAYAGERLAEIVQTNAFNTSTGFAGTPFICEALAKSGHVNVAYAMLLNTKCPSWLYPVTMGATTVWERWDSIKPDGSINPGEMTSFNHYALGAVGTFLFERVAGLQRLEPGWKRSRFTPEVIGGDGIFLLAVDVEVFAVTKMEVVLPTVEGERVDVVGSGDWSFKCLCRRALVWPVEEVSRRPI